MNRLSSVVNNFARNTFANLSPNTETFCALRISASQLSTYSNGNKALKTNISENCLAGSWLLARSTIFPITTLKLGEVKAVQSIRHKWTRASGRVGAGPRGNNGKRSPLTIQGAFQCHPHKKNFKKTLSRRFPGHVDVFNRKGERDPLVAAEERYKRLDWGWYIGTRVGRYNKMWSKTEYENWRDEQHVSLSKDANDKLEKMFSPQAKRPRFLPDDPYEKYNSKVNYWKYHWGLVKNKELIRKYGNPVYRFNRYQAHMRMESDENIKSNLYYAPPGYLETIGSNPSGMYRPDLASALPKVETAPHFQRQRLSEPPRKPRSKGGRRMLGRELPKAYTKLRELEIYSKEKIPLWSPINFPTIHEM